MRNRVEKFISVDQFWAFMDGEYGDEDELVCDRLAYLRQYRHPKDAKTDAEKFWGMYERFHEVYSDMEKVDSLAKLDHPASLQEFTKHLPAESLKKYVEQWRAGKVKKTSGLEILRTFLEEERQFLKDYKQLVGEQSVEEVTNSQGPSRSGKPNKSPKNQS